MANKPFNLAQPMRGAIVDDPALLTTAMQSNIDGPHSLFRFDCGPLFS